MKTRSEKVRIEAAGGHTLAGIIERPEAKPAEYAIFAHCFTCSKDSLAAVRVSRALARRGIGVLRLDFTGLGESEGEFADSTFSTRLSDLEDAAGFLRRAYGPPRILIGHSLGGAAALAVASEIEQVEAVATIAAPSDPAHLTRLLEESTPELEERGEAEVDIGGRPFCIRQSFVDDLREHDLLADVEGLRRPLLLLHSPTDNIVGIDHARKIFEAARHPKSFVSLDDADHLLTRREDADYVAAVLDAWAARFVGRLQEREEASGDPREAEEPLDHGEVLVRESGNGKFHQEVVAGKHRLAADEPEDLGGDDRGPSPYELLSAGLGACTSMTLRMYADRKEWPLERVTVRLRHQKIHAEDCADCDTEKGKLDEIEREIEMEGDLDEEQRQRLLEIADRCPVHRTLHEEVKVRSREMKD